MDLVSSLVRTRLAGVVPEVGLQIRVFAVVSAVDACLAPLGFLAGIATGHEEAAVLFVPLVLFLWLLARDRSQRIDKAHHRLKLLERERAVFNRPSAASVMRSRPSSNSGRCSRSSFTARSNRSTPRPGDWS